LHSACEFVGISLPEFCLPLHGLVQDKSGCLTCSGVILFMIEEKARASGNT
jgi:hypothetical protein